MIRIQTDCKLWHNEISDLTLVGSVARVFNLSFFETLGVTNRGSAIKRQKTSDMRTYNRNSHPFQLIQKQHELKKRIFLPDGNLSGLSRQFRNSTYYFAKPDGGPMFVCSHLGCACTRPCVGGDMHVIYFYARGLHCLIL